MVRRLKGWGDGVGEWQSLGEGVGGFMEKDRSERVEEEWG